MTRSRRSFVLALSLFAMGNTDCGGVQSELPEDTTTDLPGGITNGADLGALAGECMPASFIYCGNTVTGDTNDWNTGVTDVMDGYPVSVGNYGGSEIVWAFQATKSETASFALIDAEPTVINHDIFILEQGSTGTCESSNATARGFNSIDFDVVAGNTYFVVLDSFEGEGGVFEAELSCTGETGEVTNPEPSSDRPTAEVFFSPLAVEDSHLARTAELIDAATSTLDIAMYSFSYQPMMEALERAHDRGVSIRVMTYDASKHRKAPEGTRSAALEDMGIQVRWINKIQHHKFVIVDGPREDVSKADEAWLVTGSANWSWSAAQRYDENTVVVQGDERLVLEFQQEFELLWDNSRDVVWNESIVHVEGTGPTQADIDAAPIFAEPTFTSANMTTFVNSHGPGFSTTNGSGAARNELADLILGAEESIWIASGHLRSRQITDAIFKAVDEDPTLDVRVYLDGQEYASWTRHDAQVEDYEECMANATTQGQRNDCADKGIYFGFDLAEAGVPLRYKHYSYHWHYSYAAQMHHKYLIVDGSRVASGSYNFSNNAEHDTMENLVVFEAVDYPELVEAFVDNFESIWVTGLDGRFEALLDEVTNGTDDIPLVYDSMALTHAEVTTLKDAIRAACPDVDSEDFRQMPQQHKVCAR